MTARGIPVGFSAGGSGRGMRLLLSEAAVFCCELGFPAHAMSCTPQQFAQADVINPRIRRQIQSSKLAQDLGGDYRLPFLFQAHQGSGPQNRIKMFSPLASVGAASG